VCPLRTLITYRSESLSLSRTKTMFFPSGENRGVVSSNTDGDVACSEGAAGAETHAANKMLMTAAGRDMPRSCGCIGPRSFAFRAPHPKVTKLRPPRWVGLPMGLDTPSGALKPGGSSLSASLGRDNHRQAGWTRPASQYEVSDRTLSANHHVSGVARKPDRCGSESLRVSLRDGTGIQGRNGMLQENYRPDGE
jgi:hypothetical protein